MDIQVHIDWNTYYGEGGVEAVYGISAGVRFGRDSMLLRAR